MGRLMGRVLVAVALFLAGADGLHSLEVRQPAFLPLADLWPVMAGSPPPWAMAVPASLAGLVVGAILLLLFRRRARSRASFSGLGRR